MLLETLSLRDAGGSASSSFFASAAPGSFNVAAGEPSSSLFSSAAAAEPSSSSLFSSAANPQDAYVEWIAEIIAAHGGIMTSANLGSSLVADDPEKFWALLEQLYDNDLSLLRDSMKSADEKSDVVSYTLDSAKGISGTHQARYLGEVIITSGSSMDANESSPTLKGYRYELKGTATMAGSGAGATIYKGIEYY